MSKAKIFLLLSWATMAALLPLMIVSSYRAGDKFFAVFGILAIIFALWQFKKTLGYGPRAATLVVGKVVTRRFVEVDIPGFGKQELEVPEHMAMKEQDIVDLRGMVNCGGPYFWIRPVKRGNKKDEK